MEFGLLATKGKFEGIPDIRQVIHKQYIIMQNRWIFDVELSFDKMKFFIVVKRKLSIKPIAESQSFISAHQRD